jgi:hypothetical protein
LVVGIYLSNKKNCIDKIVRELSRATHHKISQHWIALGDGKISQEVERHTKIRILQKTPKFKLLNELLARIDLSEFDVLMVSDDDILLPPNFLNRFLEIQYFCDFSLCQPSRSHNSWIDHAFVEQVNKSLARQTRFVEIGPIFSIRSDAFQLILPFCEMSPMGWGLDFVWPLLIEGSDKKMGIIDAVPVDHSLRKPVLHYDWHMVKSQQDEYLKVTPHLTPGAAFSVIKQFGLNE